MYEHYERHRTDNITDPALRRAHPISTISGWDRDQDQSTENTTKNNRTLNENVITNTQPNVSQAEISYEVSKSEQTDDDDVVVLDVKCVCEEDLNKNETSLSNGPEIGKVASAQILNSVGSDKPVQSISSISQVYNEQLTGQSVVCNGDSEHVFNENTTSTVNKEMNTSDDGSTSGSDALRKTLEIDSYDINEEDSKEIVGEIVEEILTKSENLLDDCKRPLDENHQHSDETETTSSPVIKDGEIEYAVSEVVKGVRNIKIERKVKRDSQNETDSQNIELDSTLNQEPQNIEKSSNSPNDESSDRQNENQKTELVLSNAAIEQTKDMLYDDVKNEIIPKKTAVSTDSDEIKDIVTSIVNDVIENCVKQTAIDYGNVCDNDVNKMSIIDNINNNSSDVATNDNNDNAIIVETITDPVSTMTILETNEKIIKVIVNEIFDKCVENEAKAATDNDKNNNDGEKDVTPSNAGNEEFAADTTSESPSGEQPSVEVSAKFASATSEMVDISDDNNKTQLDDNPSTTSNRSQGTTISTSTQVENNHFGNLALYTVE